MALPRNLQMIYFALTFMICSKALGCQWIAVEYFDTEEQCIAAGYEYTIDINTIDDVSVPKWKCVVKAKDISPPKGKRYG